MNASVIYTFLLLLIIYSALFINAKYDKTKKSFMDKEDANFLRAFWCIVIFLVHVPVAYQNKMQDAVGSFAYIGVTFYFMTSGYGLKYSISHKKDYMSHFWRNRFPSLFIPAIIINIISILLGAIKGYRKSFSLISIIDINNWVKLLLILYLIFWIIYYIIPKKIKGGQWQDITIVAAVAVISIIQYFIKSIFIWPVEVLGFAYGIIAAKYFDTIIKWICNKTYQKIYIFLGASLALGGGVFEI